MSTHVPFSEREKQVISLVVLQCKSSKEAARAMGLSFRTVEVFRSHIMEKLGARNFAEMVLKLGGDDYAERILSRIGNQEGPVLLESEGRLPAPLL